MLSQSEIGCKQDMKAGWHHIKYHPSQQARFGYLYARQVWIYKAGAFGDSTLPYTTPN